MKRGWSLLFIYFGEYRGQSTATTLSLLGYEDPLSHSEVVETLLLRSTFYSIFILSEPF